MAKLSDELRQSVDPEAPAKGGIVESALPILMLMEEIAQELRPLTFDQISSILETSGRPTPKATLHRQLKTLEAAGWLTAGTTGKYRPSIKFNGLAVAYQERVIERLQQQTDEANAVKNSAKEIIERATQL